MTEPVTPTSTAGQAVLSYEQIRSLLGDPNEETLREAIAGTRQCIDELRDAVAEFGSAASEATEFLRTVNLDADLLNDIWDEITAFFAAVKQCATATTEFFARLDDAVPTVSAMHRDALTWHAIHGLTTRLAEILAGDETAVWRGDAADSYQKSIQAQRDAGATDSAGDWIAGTLLAGFGAALSIIAVTRGILLLARRLVSSFTVHLRSRAFDPRWMKSITEELDTWLRSIKAFYQAADAGKPTDDPQYQVLRALAGDTMPLVRRELTSAAAGIHI